MLPETKWEQQSRRGKVANNYSDQRKSIPTASAMHLDHGLTVMGLCPVVTRDIDLNLCSSGRFYFLFVWPQSDLIVLLLQTNQRWYLTELIFLLFIWVCTLGVNVNNQAVSKQMFCKSRLKASDFYALASCLSLFEPYVQRRKHSLWLNPIISITVSYPHRTCMINSFLL